MFLKKNIKLSIVYRLHTLYAKVFPLYDIKNLNSQGRQYLGYVEKFDQDANDYIFNVLSMGKPCMISKFGTFELDVLEDYKLFANGKHLSIIDYWNFIRHKISSLTKRDDIFEGLCNNAGFFPNNSKLIQEFYKENILSMRQIDVLGSYQINEWFFREELKKAIRVNLDGYYAPFYYKNPWTKYLRGKKVLVVHPFVEDIEKQYKKRCYLWNDEDVLPEFKLITYKAVQSIAGTETKFVTWFDALQAMKDDIEKIDYDIALIGCGAYGMPLAAFCKQMGKQAIHLAGWLQILFGIKGTRWDNNPRVSEFYNAYWIRPSIQNKPLGAELIENGCYW